jgi:hypothetical protein
VAAEVDDEPRRARQRQHAEVGALLEPDDPAQDSLEIDRQTRPIVVDPPRRDARISSSIGGRPQRPP